MPCQRGRRLSTISACSASSSTPSGCSRPARCSTSAPIIWLKASTTSGRAAAGVDLAPRGQGGRQPVQRLPQRGVQGLVGPSPHALPLQATKRVQAQVELERVGQVVADKGRARGAHLGFGGVVGPPCGGQGGFQLGQAVVQQGRVDGLLAVELRVDGTGGATGTRGNAPHAGAFQALEVELFTRGPQDAVTPGFGRGRLRFRRVGVGDELESGVAHNSVISFARQGVECVQTRGGQRPDQRGLRFSAKALGPSCASALA